jgi:hypothetical protein
MRWAILDRWVGLIVMAFALLWCWLVETTIPARGMEGAPGPRAFPMLLGTSLFVLGGIVAALTFVGRFATNEDRCEPAHRDEIMVVGGGIALFLLYAFLMDKVGFLLATPVVVVLALRLILGLRDWLRIVLAAFALTVGCDLLFGVLMEANLPQGAWFSL